MRKEENCIVFIFAVIILGFFIGDLLAPEKSFSSFENRKLATRPDFSIKAVADGSYMQDYEAYVSDQFIGRNQFIGIKTMTDVVLGQKEVNGIYLASDGSLIEKHTKEFTEENIRKTTEKLKILQSMLHGRCGHFQVLLVPTADNVYAGKLPPYAEVFDEASLWESICFSCRNTKNGWDGQQAELAEAAFVDVFTVLRQHADEYIYYKTDHHWTTMGAYYAYTEWAKNRGVQPVDYRKKTVSVEFFGTLHSATNLPFLSPDTIEAYDYKGFREVFYDFDPMPETSLYAEKYLKTKNQYGYFLNDNHAFVEIRATDGAGGSKKGISLFVIKDSFANCMIPLLSEHYDTIYVLDLRYYKGKISSLIDTYVTDDTDVLILYNMAHFVEEFRFY